MFRAARLGFTPAEIEKAKEKARTDAAEKLRASKSKKTTPCLRDVPCATFSTETPSAPKSPTASLLLPSTRSMPMPWRAG